MDVAESLVDLIGHTPMVRLDRTARDLECTLVAKLELFNPGGSSKDRIALGHDRGRPSETGGSARAAPSWSRRAATPVWVSPSWRPGGATAASSCAPTRSAPRRSPSCAPTAPRSSSVPPRCRPNTPSPTTRSRTAWPARCPTPGSPTSTTTPTILGRNTRRQEPEIWEQTHVAGSPTSWPASGRGGTVTGIGRYLKERNPAVQIIGADPEGSVYSGGSGTALPGRGHRRGLLAHDLRPLGGGPGDRRLRRRELLPPPGG